MLVNRLKAYLLGLIIPLQSVFVAGRMIHDNVLVAHALFHYLQHRISGRKTECALKLDMQKVYDLAEWEFLIQSLERHDFGGRWIQWIRACIITPTYKVLVNGNRTTWIQPTRGLRQGDPLLV